MKTLGKIKEKAKSLGVPDLYISILQGKKCQQIEQIKNWFQRSINWAVIRDEPVNPLDRQRLIEFTTFIES